MGLLHRFCLCGCSSVPGTISRVYEIGTVVLLAAGVIVLAPVIQMPPVTEFIHGGGPIIPGMVFPFVFITIACGAISGFHSLIASGTTPKMIQKESEIRMIGYGAMLVEGFVGVIALIAATILIPGDYLAINTKLSPEQLASMGFPVSRITELSSLVGVDVAGRPGGAVSLAVGISSILSSLPGMKGLMSYWYQFALLFEALFILTTIDAGTRVARFMFQELIGLAYAPFRRTESWGANVVCTGIAVACWGYFLYQGVVDPLGAPIDGLGEIASEGRRALELQAPGVMQRKSVHEPLQTGIKAIDAMIPVAAASAS